MEAVEIERDRSVAQIHTVEVDMIRGTSSVVRAVPGLIMVVETAKIVDIERVLGA